MKELPEAFLHRLQNQFPEEREALIAALHQPAPVSVRQNSRKPSSLPFETRANIPWCAEGWYLESRPTFILDPLWHAGTYYVQEASSMLLDFALRQTTPLNQPLTVLDICAAPGGKATLLINRLNENSLLIANEVIRTRVAPLTENLVRWGFPNVVITNHDPETFAQTLRGYFDVVVVDAPCSGEGLFRKDPEAIREWSEENGERCAARQKRILTAAQELVRPDGLLFYSTCTLNPAENEANIHWLLAQGGWEIVPLTLPNEWGLRLAEVGYQCLPHRCVGEGFYLCVLRRTAGTAGELASPSSLSGVFPISNLDKTIAQYLAEPENWMILEQRGKIAAVPISVAGRVRDICTVLPRSQPILRLGEYKGRDFVPAHELALSLARHADIPAIVLDRDSALRYLRKDPFDLPQDSPSSSPGWCLATYRGQSLGWLKVLPGRFNNYLPNEWRIRREIR